MAGRLRAKEIFDYVMDASRKQDECVSTLFSWLNTANQASLPEVKQEVVELNHYFSAADLNRDKIEAVAIALTSIKEGHQTNQHAQILCQALVKVIFFNPQQSVQACIERIRYMFGVGTPFSVWELISPYWKDFIDRIDVADSPALCELLKGLSSDSPTAEQIYTELLQMITPAKLDLILQDPNIARQLLTFAPRGRRKELVAKLTDPAFWANWVAYSLDPALLTKFEVSSELKQQCVEILVKNSDFINKLFSIDWSTDVPSQVKAFEKVLNFFELCSPEQISGSIGRQLCEKMRDSHAGWFVKWKTCSNTKEEEEEEEEESYAKPVLWLARISSEQLVRLWQFFSSVKSYDRSNSSFMRLCQRELCGRILQSPTQLMDLELLIKMLYLSPANIVFAKRELLDVIKLIISPAFLRCYDGYTSNLRFHFALAALYALKDADKSVIEPADLRSLLSIIEAGLKNKNENENKNLVRKLHDNRQFLEFAMHNKLLFRLFGLDRVINLIEFLRNNKGEAAVICEDKQLFADLCGPYIVERFIAEYRRLAADEVSKSRFPGIFVRMGQSDFAALVEKLPAEQQVPEIITYVNRLFLELKEKYGHDWRTLARSLPRSMRVCLAEQAPSLEALAAMFNCQSMAPAMQPFDRVETTGSAPRAADGSGGEDEVKEDEDPKLVHLAAMRRG